MQKPKAKVKYIIIYSNPHHTHRHTHPKLFPKHIKHFHIQSFSTAIPIPKAYFLQFSAFEMLLILQDSACVSL